MISLTRLNGIRLDVNCDLIKYTEASPDTVLTLITGEKLIVLESCDEVSDRTRMHRAAILREAWPEANPVIAAKAAFDAYQKSADHPTSSQR